MPSELIKVWEDWSAGVGFPVDDGRTPGWHFGTGMRGQPGCLAPTRATEYVVVGFEEYNDDHAIATFNTGNAGSYAAASFMSDSPSTTGTSRGTAQSASNSGANTNSQNITVASGTDILVICIMNDTNRNVDAITFDTTRTLADGHIVLAASGTDGTRRTSIYTLNDADDDGTFDGTSNPVVVTFSGTCENVVTLFTIDGAVYKSGRSTCDGDGSTTTIAVSVTFEADRTLSAYQSGHVIVALTTTQDRVGLGSEFTNVVEDATSGAMFGNVVERVPDVPVDIGDTVGHTWHTYQYFIEEELGVSGWTAYLYGIRGGTEFEASPVFMEKFDVSAATEIALKTGNHTFQLATVPHPEIPGQPARYRGFWYFPAGNDHKPYKLTVASGGAMSDTLTATAASFVAGSDHYVMLGFSLAGAVEEGTNSGGLRLLAIDPANDSTWATTDANWGSDFPTGDITRRPQGLVSTDGLAFVLNPEGLYSFNNAARSNIVWEDFRGWIDFLKNVQPRQYSGGLLVPHPSGLYFWSVGGLPVNVSIDKNEWNRRPAQSLITDFTGGRYHSIVVAGDYVYAIYQPNFTSLTAYVLCGYKKQSPEDLGWIVLDSFALTQDHTANSTVAMPHGIGVSLAGRLSSGDTQAAIVYGVGGDLAYIRLDQHGTPYERPIASVPYTPRTSANAWMSELVFPTETKLERIVVYTRNLVSGTDSFVLSRVADDDGIERTIGASIIANGRNVRDLGGLICTTFDLNVTYAGGTSHSTLPMITRIELWGSQINHDRR